MRVLFTTQPAHGHLHPLLPFAIACRDAGHDVAFATARLFCPAVEAMGFEAHPAGHDYLWERAEEFFPEGIEASQTGAGLEWTMRNVTYGRVLGPMVDDLLKLIDRWRPDVLVHDIVEAGAVIAGELKGLAVVSGSWGIGPQDDWGFDAGENWNASRRRWGLAPDHGGAAAARWLVLTSMPPSWTRLSGGERPTTRSFRVPATDARPGDALPGWLAERDGHPLVYATVGTVFNQLPRLFDKLMLAFEEVAVDVLLTVGRNVDPAGLEAPPPNVRIERYVPQSLVLGRCDLVLSHAGFGTVFGALAAGVPMVLMTLGADHAFNAQRAYALGTARVIPPRRLDVATITAMVREGLADEDLRARTAQVRDEISALPPVGEAVAALEQLAAGPG